MTKLNLKTKIALVLVFPFFLIIIMALFVIAVTLYASAVILKITGIIDAFEFLFAKLSKKLKKYAPHSPIARKN